MTQHDALAVLKMGYNVFLTGKAGSGKTYVLSKYINYLKERGVSVAVTASTGIAASHMDGVTIHSWSGLGIRSTLSDFDLEMMSEKKYLHDRFSKVKVLVIDEISMLHHYRLDLVDKILRYFKQNNDPFGGIQVVLCGDFFQLPPVSRAGEIAGRFAFHAQAWKNAELKVCYLEESHRQNDMELLSILNAIRENDVTDNILALLRSRIGAEVAGHARLTKLYTHNENVDAINMNELGVMQGNTHLHKMQEHGRDLLVKSLKSTCLAPEFLHLKIGAHVMFVKNNYEVGYVNGTLGEVVNSTFEYVDVKTVRGQTIRALPQDWVIEENGKIKARVSQIPLRLAWAITIHKSQGMTLDAAEIDLGKAFEPGMGYVALSRVRSLAGLRLINLNATALLVNQEVAAHDVIFKEKSARIEGHLKMLREDEVEARIERYISDIAPAGGAKKKAAAKKAKKERGGTYEVTKELLAKGMSLAAIAAERGFTEGTIVSHLEQLLMLGKIKPEEIVYIRREKITDDAFEDIKDTALRIQNTETGAIKLNDLKAALPSHVTFDEIKIALLFVK